jgi:hypothetical protein
MKPARLRAVPLRPAASAAEPAVVIVAVVKARTSVSRVSQHQLTALIESSVININNSKAQL